MRDNRTYGSEGGAAQSNESSLPLSNQRRSSALREPNGTTNSPFVPEEQYHPVLIMAA
jgi:hypothetical protein